MSNTHREGMHVIVTLFHDPEFFHGMGGYFGVAHLMKKG